MFYKVSNYLLSLIVTLSPNADTGNKFIFHNKIFLCKYIVPQRRKKQKCAIFQKRERYLPIFILKLGSQITYCI